MDEDRIEGKLKQGEGNLTGDDDRAAEGEAQENWGKAKDKVDNAKDAAQDKLDDAKDKIT